MGVKARLVARGFGQRAGVDCFETFSPCPSVASIRVLADIAHESGLDLCHFYAEQVYVQSGIIEDAYMRLAKGRGTISGAMDKLCRSLHDLKRSWWR